MSNRYAFIAEWFDTIASQTREYTVCFYPEDNTVEMIDNKLRKVFLRRTAVPNNLSEFFIGGAVTIYSRQLKITSYADNFTAVELGNRLERTLLLVKPSGVGKISSILNAVGSTGLSVVAARMVSLDQREASQFASDAGTFIGLEVVGNSAISIIAALAGAGSDIGRGSCYASSDEPAAESDLDFFVVKKAGELVFSGSENSSLCIIKPSLFGRNATSFAEVVSELKAGGFEVTGIVSQNLNRASAQDFLEVYKGVVGEYIQMVDELTSGPLLALEVTGGTSESSFRDFCGPSDPEIAKQLRPHTLRAKFGEDTVKNGIHCTDLTEDIPLELEYFFRILA